jgi:hypothetical protein
MSYISLLGFFDGHSMYWTSLHPPLENMKFIHVFFLLFCGSFWPSWIQIQPTKIILHPTPTFKELERIRNEMKYR